MDRYILKNIIIIILVLVNGFLLGSLLSHQSAERSVREEAESHITELFAADGIALAEGAISHQTPPAALTLTRDSALQQKAAAFFLGQNLVQEDQSGTASFVSDSGVARFRSGGTFEIEGKLATADAEKLCEKFCKTFSFEPPVFTLDKHGSGTAVSVCLYEELPVANCTVTFTMNKGILTRVSGTLLPAGSAAAQEQQDPLSSMAALTVFQKARRESDAVVSAVTDMQLCYELQSSSTAALSLTPCWEISTDTLEYYVNCSTGAVTAR